MHILFMEMYVTGIFKSYNIDKDEVLNEQLTFSTTAFSNTCMDDFLCANFEYSTTKIET